MEHQGKGWLLTIVALFCCCLCCRDYSPEERVSDVKQGIVTYLAVLAEKRPLSDDQLLDLQRLLQENERRFERQQGKFSLTPDWFGNPNEVDSHVSLYYHAIEGLRLQLKEHYRAEIVRTIWMMAETLTQIAADNAEWGAVLEESVSELAFEQPEHFVRFFASVPSAEARRLLSHLDLLVDYGKAERFEKELRHVSETNEELRYAAIEVLNHMKFLRTRDDLR